MNKKTKRLLIALSLGIALCAAIFVVWKVGKRVLRNRDVFASASDSVPRKAAPLEVAETVYEQKLSAGWDDWGWGPHELGSGPAKVKFAGYGGILFHHSELVWRYGGVAFRYKAPAHWRDFLQVALRAPNQPDDVFPVIIVRPRHIAAVEDGWSEVLIDWKELNPSRKSFDRLLIGSRLQVDGAWAELDRVVFTKPPAQDTQQGSLRVVCDGKSHAISDLIYGQAGAEWSSGQTAQRMGGNPLSRDNWEIGAWNTGHDWFFENVGQPTNIFEDLESASRERHKIALVVPMLGWVAKDKSSFGFPREKFGQQRKHDPWKAEAGDGYRPDGTPIRPGDPSQTSIPAPPELIGQWVKRVAAQDAKHGFRSVHMYILDNEPSLWNVTHRDVFPDPLSYDQLLDLTLKYAGAIREADPEAVIAGPAEWGHTGYEYSAVDREAGVALQPDRRAHGGQALVAWYLKKLAEHEKATGKRLLDVFDLHFYPAAQGVYGGNAGTDPATSELRLRSTRALWDPDYMDESWINDKLRLIPRMKDWVRENYPGRKIVIGEWSFGADEHISGGLATAEALGRFGQQGLDGAFHWGGLKKGSATYWAFRAFRDFDGRGGRFQDISLPTSELDHVSLFASRDAEMRRLVLVLVNRDATTKVRARIALKGCGSMAAPRLFSFTAESAQLDEKAVALTSEGGSAALTATLEPYSFSVIALETPKK